MRTTLTVIKADIGSIGGHLRPSDEVVDCVRNFVRSQGAHLIIDSTRLDGGGQRCKPWNFCEFGFNTDGFFAGK